MSESIRKEIKKIREQLNQEHGEVREMYLIETEHKLLRKKAWFVCHKPYIGTIEPFMYLGHQGMLPALIITDLDKDWQFYSLTDNDKKLVRHTYRIRRKTEHDAMPQKSTETEDFKAQVRIPKNRGNYTFKGGGWDNEY